MVRLSLKQLALKVFGFCPNGRSICELAYLNRS